VGKGRGALTGGYTLALIFFVDCMCCDEECCGGSRIDSNPDQKLAMGSQKPGTSVEGIAKKSEFSTTGAGPS
jgi:hypothetical protein